MPKMYEDIKASELAAGKSPKEAKRIAAATYNKHAAKNGLPSLAEYVKREKGGGLLSRKKK